MQCNGHNPCVRCEGAGIQCTYAPDKRVTEQGLRSEVERLRAINSENVSALQALFSSQPNSREQETDIQGQLLGEERQTIFSSLPVDHGDEIRTEIKCMVDRSLSSSLFTTANVRTAESTLSEPPDGLNTFEQCHDPRVAQATALQYGARNPGLSDEEVPEGAKWIHNDWSTVYTKSLLQKVLTLDCLTFCVPSQELFLEDYASYDSRYCSSALVYSLLSLAFGLIDDVLSDQEIQFTTNKHFAAKAADIIRLEDLPGLPDIQALGVLSIYELCRGDIVQGKKLANTFTRSITDFCLNENTESTHDICKRVRSATFCGAISLSRYVYIRLVTNSVRILI